MAQPPPAPRDPVIDLLRAQGVNLAKPRLLTFYCYFSSEAQARQAAERLKAADFQIRLDPPRPKVPGWSVKAERTEVLDEAMLAKLVGVVEPIVRQYGGEYDGWETPAER